MLGGGGGGGGWEWLGLWPVGKGERRREDKDKGLGGRASSALALCVACVPCGLVPWFSFQPHFKKFYLFLFFSQHFNYFKFHSNNMRI